MHKITVAFVLLCAAAALAQERPPASLERRFPVDGQYKPSPQLDPTRIIALVPVVPVPGTANAKAPLFLEDRESPLKQPAERVKTDSSKAEVPAGIVSFRAMYSNDNAWALVDLQARDAASLEGVRAPLEVRVRFFTAEELLNPEAIDKAGTLPEGLSLAAFLNR